LYDRIQGVKTMIRKSLTTTALAAALVTSGVGQASADIGDAIAGGIIGGVIVGAIQNNNQRQPARTTSPSTRAVSSAARQEARAVQTALNTFGFDVGVPDGVLGRQSRAGISQYQAYMGFNPTGDLDGFQRDVLLQAYQRNEMGGAAVTQVVMGHPDGRRGLLLVVRDEMLGLNTRVAAPAQPQPAVPATGVPNLFAGQGGAVAGTAVSLASHCNRVALITSSNGGYTDLGRMTDAGFALNEQFCLARGYAIAEGEALMAQIPGMTQQMAAQQCAGIASSMQGAIGALGMQPRAAVLASASQFALTSGMTAPDLANTARVCLSSGYATDNLPVAIGSALILTALGETAYGELPAHHLMQGIGAPQRPDLAAEWFRASVPGPGAATMSVSFQPGPATRNALILAAVDHVAGPAPGAVPTAPQPAMPAGK